MNSLLTLLFLLMLAACSPQDEKSATADKSEEKNIAVTSSLQADDQMYSFDIDTLKPGCSSDSQIICAINLTIKCTINPDFTECTEQKDKMPSFVFMLDENLNRPTSQSYRINKIKPLTAGNIEIYTHSTCNGNWFGLCNGNIIYVMGNHNNEWIVKDIYAVEY